MFPHTGRPSSEEKGLLKASDDGGKPSSLSLGAAVQLSSRYVASSIARDRRGFCVGLATVCIVVTFTALLRSAIQVSPIIFLKLAENQAGEADLVLLPEVSSTSSLPFMNYSAVKEALATNTATFAGVAPRWPLYATFLNPSDPTLSSSGFALAIDSNVEASIGLGRMWDRRALGSTECYASSTILDETGVRAGAGDLLDVKFDVLSILSAIQAAAGGVGGSSSGGGNGTATPLASNQALLSLVLAAAGIQLENLNVQVNVAVAIEALLLASGLLNPANVAAFNLTALEAAFPVLGLITVDIGPLIASAVASAASSLSITASYVVVDAIPANPGGKFTTVLGNVVILEAAHLTGLLQNTIQAALAQVQGLITPLLAAAGSGAGTAALANTVDRLDTLIASVTNISYEGTLQHYALEIDVVVAARGDLYLNAASALDLTLGLTSWGDALMGGILGPSSQVLVTNPLGTTLIGLQFIALFLSQIFIVTLAVIALLGAVVIYSLVLGDVDGRTYELGMLRALGLGHYTLSLLLCLQTLAFAVPGILLGLLISSLLNLAVVEVAYWYAAITLPLAMVPTSWAISISLGVLVPALAIAYPIRRALSTALRDALDLSHQVTQDVTVKIVRLAEVGLSAPQLALSLMLIGIGFLTFYAIPLSFVYQNFAAFLGILTGILLCMLVGLSLLAQSLTPALEHLVLTLLLYITGDAGRLGTVTRKALAGHRPHNSKTSYLIAITIGFLVFIAAMFGLQAASIVRNVRMFLGADIVAIVPNSVVTSSSSSSSSAEGLPQLALMAFLEEDKAKAVGGGIVNDYTFVTVPLNALAFIRRSALSNLLSVPATRSAAYGVQENYLDVAYSEFTITTEHSYQGLTTSSDMSPSVASANPILALYQGESLLSLAVEEALRGAPPPPVSAGGDGSVPLYVCSSTIAAARDAFEGGGVNLSASAAASSQQCVLPTVAEAALPAAGINSATSGWSLALNGLTPAEAWSVVGGSATSPSSSSFSTNFLFAQGCGPYGCTLNSTVGQGGITGPAFPLSRPSAAETLLAYTDYNYCLLVCNIEAQVALAGNASSPPPQCMSTEEAMEYVSEGLLATPPVQRLVYPFYLEQGSASNASSLSDYLNGGGGGSAPSSSSPSSPLCWLPSQYPCFSTSRYSRADETESTSSIYLSYLDVIISEAMRPANTLTTTTPLALRLLTADPRTNLALSRVYLAKARAMVRKLPGFVFSSYPQTAARAPVITTMANAARIYADSLLDYAAIRRYVADLALTSPAAAAAAAASASGSAVRVLPNATALWLDSASYFCGAASSGNGSSASAAGSSNSRIDIGLPSQAAWVASKSAWFLGGASDPPSLSPPSSLGNSALYVLDSNPDTIWLLGMNWSTSAPRLPPSVLGSLLLSGAPILSGVGTVSGQSSIVGLPADEVDRLSALEYSLRASFLSPPYSLASALPPLPLSAFTPPPDLQKPAAFAQNNSAWLQFDLGSCGSVSAVRVTTSTLSSAAVIQSAFLAPLQAAIAAPAALGDAGIMLSLLALSDARGLGGAQFVGQAFINFTHIAQGGEVEVFSFTESFSARYWAVIATPVAKIRGSSAAAASQASADSFPIHPTILAAHLPLLIPDLQLRLARVASSACQGTGIGNTQVEAQVPKGRLLISLKPTATERERSKIINGIKSILNSPLVVVQDTKTLLASTDVAVLGFNIFFNFVATLALILAFFASWLSFSSNVSENSIEFGILRSLGLTSAAVTRAYVYEALSVVMAAYLLGTVVGLIVAITLTLQFNLFTEMPFTFIFPSVLFSLTLLGSILLAIVASCVPARYISRINIANVLKGRTQA